MLVNFWSEPLWLKVWLCAVVRSEAMMLHSDDAEDSMPDVNVEPSQFGIRKAVSGRIVMIGLADDDGPTGGQLME